MSDFLLGGNEILLVADAVARDKGVERELIVQALEEAIRIAARKKYGNDFSLRVVIDRRSGAVKIYRDMLVVETILPQEEELEDESAHSESENNIQEDQEDIWSQTQLSKELQEQAEAENAEEKRRKSLNKILHADAKLKKADAEIGDIISDELPPLDLMRGSAVVAKQVIIENVRKIMKQKEIEDFSSRVGEIVSGVIYKVERNQYIIKVGESEAVLPKNQSLRTDRYKQGDRIRALLEKVEPNVAGYQLFLSRSSNDFLRKLFEQEIPEVYDNTIQIRDVAREPGVKAKVSVYASDNSIDPVGSCVGIRGARVMAITNELNGEKIDIIKWTSDLISYVIAAMSPANALKVIVDEDAQALEVVVPEDQLSLAIGRRGQNIRLASKLTGWYISVISEEEESRKRNEEFEKLTARFMECLDLEEILAQLLASEGFSSLTQLAEVEEKELASIEGLDEEIAIELKRRAAEYIAEHGDYVAEVAAVSSIGSGSDSVNELENLVGDMNLNSKLLNAGIDNIVKLADLSIDEFEEEVQDHGLEAEEIGQLIMSARNFLEIRQQEQEQKQKLKQEEKQNRVSNIKQ